MWKQHTISCVQGIVCFHLYVVVIIRMHSGYQLLVSVKRTKYIRCLVIHWKFSRCRGMWPLAPLYFALHDQGASVGSECFISHCMTREGVGHGVLNFENWESCSSINYDVLIMAHPNWCSHGGGAYWVDAPGLAVTAHLRGFLWKTGENIFHQNPFVVYFSLKYVTKTIVKLIVDDFNEHDDFLMSDFRKYYAYFSIDILTKGIAIIAFRLMTCCAEEMRINNVTEPP